MTTNKERIELLEEKLGGVQEGMQRMEVGITDKIQRLEETIAKLSEAFLSSRGSPSHNNYQQEGSHRTNRDTGENIRPFSSKIAKLEFPRFSGDDPTEWLNRVDQFFEFQEIAADQKGSISWEAFEDEVRARFGPPDSEDFDEALSRALVGTFMGGLKPEVADGIRMFKPQSVKEAISLAKMRDDQLARQRQFTRPSALRASVPEDETPEEMGGVNTTREISEIEEDDNGKEPEITLHALTGWSVPRTMRIKAIIGAHEVVALIDSGSTHNFISDRVAETLRLPVKPTTPFTVRVANGERLSCKGKYEKLTVKLQETPGIEIPPIQDTTLQGFTKEFRQRQAVFALYFQLEGQQNNEELSSDMQALLEEYSDVFVIYHLSPRREIDHKIPLKDGTEAINVRPYRYAYFQKTEIENQVQDMLNARLIRPSTSPFSSPVLLVKKKDALNAATVKDPAFLLSGSQGGYHQIRVSTPIFLNRAFRTHNGHYEYLVMPFGLYNAPSTFQAIMNSIFRPYLRKFILILGACPTYISHPSATPILRQDEQMCIRKQELEYLGHIITHHGVKVDEKKIEAMFQWNDEVEAAFLALKQAMTSTPTLAMPNFTEPFTIETDASEMELQKWVAKLLGYDYEIIFRLGHENSAADALSRRQESPLLAALHFSEVDIWKQIHEASKSDSYVRFWEKGGKVVVPVDHSLRAKLLYEVHDSKVGGHSGILRTYRRLQQQFYWPKMHKVVQEYVQKCEVCQRIKPETKAPAGLLQPLPIPAQVWEDITLDFIEGLPTSHGKDTILVVVDRLSKFAHFIPLTHPFTAKVVAENFIEGVVKLHGMPRSIISDRDPIFISKFWQEFFKLSGSKLMLSSAYHPQTDGQTEVVNRCVEQYLRCFVHQWPRKWSTYLAWAEYWYNTTYHASTKMTPYQALYGRLPPLIPAYPEGLSPVHEVDQMLLHRDELLHQLKTNLEISMNRMKQQADSKRRDIQFAVGDQVLLKLHPYRQERSSNELIKIIQPLLWTLSYFGENRSEHTAIATYTRIHPVFHVSLLKPYNGTPAVTPLDLPPLADNGIITLEPQQILDTRWIKRGDTFMEESLVHWKHLPHEEATRSPRILFATVSSSDA
ncbi:hypothetical protein AAG906_028162 [Vitis piasezkii]